MECAFTRLLLNSNQSIDQVITQLLVTPIFFLIASFSLNKFVLFFSANENLKEKQDNLVKENDSLRRRIEIQETSLKESEEELKNAIAMATESKQARCKALS